MDLRSRVQNIKANLSVEQAALFQCLDSLEEDEAWRATEVPGWSVGDLVLHLAVAEPHIQTVIKRILAGQPEPPAGFDLNYWNQRQIEKGRGRTLEDLKASLRAAREETLRLLDSLTEADLNQRGIHSTGEPMTVEKLFLHIAEHQHEHGAQIRRALVETQWRR